MAETAFQIKSKKNFYSLKLTPLQLQAEQIYKGTIYAELKSGIFSICTGIHSRGEIKNYILRTYIMRASNTNLNNSIYVVGKARANSTSNQQKLSIQNRLSMNRLNRILTWKPYIYNNMIRGPSAAGAHDPPGTSHP